MNRVIEKPVSTFRLLAIEGYMVLSCNEILVINDGDFPLILAVVICMDSDVLVVRVMSTGSVLDEGFGFHLNVVVFLLSTSQNHETYY